MHTQCLCFCHGVQVIAIDEAQFFPDLFDSVVRMADDDNKCVYVAGLDGDYKREAFGKDKDMLRLVPHAESVRALVQVVVLGVPQRYQAGRCTCALWQFSHVRVLHGMGWGSQSVQLPTTCASMLRARTATTVGRHAGRTRTCAAPCVPRRDGGCPGPGRAVWRAQILTRAPFYDGFLCAHVRWWGLGGAGHPAIPDT